MGFRGVYFFVARPKQRVVLYTLILNLASKWRKNMAHKKLALRNVKISEKARQRNFAVKSKVKTLFSVAEKAISIKSKEMEKAVLSAITAIDKAVGAGMIHTNTAARKKSRLLKKLNSAKK